MTTHTETMWAIADKDGLYLRTLSRLRTKAVWEHCWFVGKDAYMRDRIWAKNRKQGDRAVKVTITYEYPE